MSAQTLSPARQTRIVKTLPFVEACAADGRLDAAPIDIDPVQDGVMGS